MSGKRAIIQDLHEPCQDMPPKQWVASKNGHLAAMQPQIPAAWSALVLVVVGAQRLQLFDPLGD
ncbi:MAG: hypothetical protein C0613_14755 [Desulfobulbaceae bacterium]|nr:MAG: hypothetical protein C0613_14755 [Desulfobulbaceae bacterium]